LAQAIPSSLRLLLPWAMVVDDLQPPVARPAEAFAAKQSEVKAGDEDDIPEIGENFEDVSNQ